ncbi:glycoside hydrolase family 2 protein [Bacteroides sp. 224]|uniref:beta-mannosidase n=1 Tax=Bacteroides sp. 224 TaxID=2302936 RepID=UPI0013D85321|nr:sugar-binding domain-containing protein [Bacteroides sp. 224]NDV64512.1 glycoside hydrolase family 2 [Bacteroides sp. 224]
MKKRNYFIFYSLLLALLFSPLTMKAQTMMGKTGLTKLWDGMKQSQPDSLMPHGKAPFQTATRKAKQNIPTKLIPVQQGEWIITDGWELGTSTQVIESKESIFSTGFDTKDWYNATVPGTVLTTLVNQGEFPDPYFGLNNMAIPDTLAYTKWWYRVSFDTPADAANQKVRLLFNGINYRAEIFLNGKKLGNMTGAFIRGEYDVTSLLKPNGKNILALLVSPPDNPGISHEQSMLAGQGLNGGQLSLDGPTFIASIGWDWIPGIRDRNTGIWQDVRLKVGGDVTIGDPQIITNLALPDTTQATVKIVTPLKNVTNRSVSGTVSAKFEGVNINMPYTLNAHEEKELVFDPISFKELTIKNPRLWWPNGYGQPNLYHLELQANTNAGFSDLKKMRFGIRELSYELMIHTPAKGDHRVAYTPVDVDNKNQPIFDYEKVVLVGNPKQKRTIPTLYNNVDEDAIFEQLSNDDPVGQYFVFRVNGVRIFIKGGTFGMDDGMKRVSHERMEPYFKLHKDANFNLIRNWVGETTEELFYELADEYGMLVWNDFWITTDDTVEPNDYDLFMKNATDVVRRFRTHPSIALWCPRNEGYAPQGMEPRLARMMAKEDPTRHYHGNSRFLNAINSGPYGYIKDQSRYFTQYAEGFNTEFGAQAIPTANTIRKFIAPEDLWPINDVWAYHDLHHTTHFFHDFMDAVNSYGESSSMDEFAKKAQMITYNTWRAMIESWNSRMWDNTTGLIMWMSHPAWPSMTWQTYTYDYETPGSYFGAKKAQEPVHVQMNMPDDKIVIVNSTRQAYKNMTLTVRYYNTSGKAYYTKSERYNVPANSKVDCFIPELKIEDTPYTLARLELKDSKGRVLSTNDYWKNWGDMQANQELNSLGKPMLKLVKKAGKGSTLVYELQNVSSELAVAVKLNAKDKSTGEIILPAYFSEGYINLIPGEKRTIKLDMPANAPKNFNIIAEGYNFDSIEL